MILVGVLLSLISGAAIPIEAFLTGRLLNIFISYNAADKISNLIITNSTSDTCTLSLVQQLLDNASSVSDKLFCDVFERGNVINSASMFVCDATNTLNDNTSTYCLYLVYLAIGIFVTTLSRTLWTITASRQSKRMRIAFYRATLNHSVGWFDTRDISLLGPQFLKYV